MVGPPVHGLAIDSSLFLIGQAPGPHEGDLGKPFAYTAGRTLFRWFNEASGVSEEDFRLHVYMAAVARCFPGKGKSGGDRVPNPEEIARCGVHLKKELKVLKPRLIIAVGKLAIEQVLGLKDFKLVDVIGKPMKAIYHGHECEVICLPHPSGLSSWHKTEPGKTLLQKALKLIVKHPAWKDTFVV